MAACVEEDGEEADVAAEQHAGIDSRAIGRARARRQAEVRHDAERIIEDERRETDGEGDVRRQQVGDGDDAEIQADEEEDPSAAAHERRKQFEQRREIEHALHGDHLVRMVDEKKVVQMQREDENHGDPEHFVSEQAADPACLRREHGIGELHDRIGQMFVLRPLAMADEGEARQRDPEETEQRHPEHDRPFPRRPRNAGGIEEEAAVGFRKSLNHRV